MMLCLSTMLFQDLLTWETPTLGSLGTVCVAVSPFNLFSSLLICYRSACSTNVSVSISFGGKSWPINPLDFNAGQIDNGRNPLCLGAIFDLSLGANNIPDSSSPSWVVGDTFLVRILSRLYLVFRFNYFFF